MTDKCGPIGVSEFFVVTKKISALEGESLCSALEQHEDRGFDRVLCQDILGYPYRYFDNEYERMIGHYLMCSPRLKEGIGLLHSLVVPHFVQDALTVLDRASFDPCDQLVADQIVVSQFLCHAMDRFSRIRPSHSFQKLYREKLFVPHMNAAILHDPAFVKRSVEAAYLGNDIPDSLRIAAVPSYATAIRSLMPTKQAEPVEWVHAFPLVESLTVAGIYFRAWKTGRGCIVKAWKHAVGEVVRHAPVEVIENILRKTSQLAHKAQQKNHPSPVCKRGVFDKPFAVGVLAACLLLQRQLIYGGVPREVVAQKLQDVSFAPLARDPS